MFPTAHVVKKYLEDIFCHTGISQKSKGTLIIYADPTKMDSGCRGAPPSQVLFSLQHAYLPHFVTSSPYKSTVQRKD